MAFWKESMINWLSNLINRNRSAAKISQVLCSTFYTTAGRDGRDKFQVWKGTGMKKCGDSKPCPTEKHFETKRQTKLAQNFSLHMY